jgi:hypothetical protein
MSDLFPGGRRDALVEKPGTVHVDPTLGERTAEARWETRAAQWRARELAEEVFGGEVAARLTGRRGGHPFRGLLHLDVPFRDLAQHRVREAAFLSAAARDPVLERVPFVFVLTPVPG